MLTLEYPPQIGGVATYLSEEVKNFSGVVSVIDAHALYGHKWPIWLPVFWRGRKKYQQHACDCVWVSHILPLGTIAYLWKVVFKTPYRVYVHGLDLVLPQTSRRKTMLIKTILKHADEIIANSNATARLLVNYDINPDKAVISYPRIRQIDIGSFMSRAKELRIAHGLAHKKIVLTIARLVRRKGVHTVIRAMREVNKKRSDITYVVVGDGPELEMLKKNAQGLPVLFLGSLDENEKNAWLSACDLFVMTPIDDPNDFEGYGIVYKEAQQFGKPVIGTRVGGVPEAIGSQGLIIEPENPEMLVRAIEKNLDTV